MLTRSIRRGLAAGLFAGLLAGLFALVAGNDPMTQATLIEEAQHADHADDPVTQDRTHSDHGHAHDDGDEHGHDHGDDHDHGEAHDHDDGDGHAHGDDHEHLFSRATQQALLPVATSVIGAALGGLFGIVFALVRPRRFDASDWRASLKLGATAWAATVLAPLLTSPANPPGVGGAATVDARTQTYTITVVVALVVAAGLWLLSHQLRRAEWRDAPRQIVVGALAVVAVGSFIVLVPTQLPGDGFPAELLWRFRLTSFATQTLLWVGIAVAFGLWWDRQEAREWRTAEIE